MKKLWTFLFQSKSQRQAAIEQKRRIAALVKQSESAMMRSFADAGGYARGLDIMGWQVGWKAFLLQTSASSELSQSVSEDAFNALYYGGGASFPFNEKSFHLAWIAAQEYKKSLEH